MTNRKLPSSANVATKGNGSRLVAPAATRNGQVLADLVARIAPENGLALELASGTGQHVRQFAQRCSDLHWHPSEVEAERLTSIKAYTDDLPNVANAVYLDALANGWHKTYGNMDLIVLINLLHLISFPEVERLITEAALALNSNGTLLLYGPFKRDGKLTSDGDRRFHDALVGQNPDIGYKNDTDIAHLLHANGLEIQEIVEMPANNLAFLAKNPDF